MRSYTCGQCEKQFDSLAELYTHRRGCHPSNLPNAQLLCENFTCDTCSLAPGTTAMNGVYRSITVTPTERCITADHFTNNIREGVNRVLHHSLLNGEDVKLSSSTSVTMVKINISDGSVEDEKTFFFTTKAVPIQTASDSGDLVDSIFTARSKVRLTSLPTREAIG